VQSNQGLRPSTSAPSSRRPDPHLAEADAERIARTGIAQALAIEEQVTAYGGPQYQVTQQVMSRFAEAIQAAQVEVGAAAWSSTAAPAAVRCGRQPPHRQQHIEGWLTMLLSDMLGVQVNEGASATLARVGPPAGGHPPEHGREAARERKRRQGAVVTDRKRNRYGPSRCAVGIPLL
jgi:hypothetical protein